MYSLFFIICSSESAECYRGTGPPWFRQRNMDGGTTEMAASGKGTKAGVERPGKGRSHGSRSVCKHPN